MTDDITLEEITEIENLRINRSKEDERVTVHARVIMTGPRSDGWKDGDDKYSSWTADLVTRYPDDRKLGTLFGDGWGNYAEFVKCATWIGIHARDILKIPVGQKRPQWDGDAYDDGVREHADAFRRAYYAKRHEAIVQRRESIREAKWDQRRWRAYGWAISKRWRMKFEVDMERRRKAGVGSFPPRILENAVANWRVEVGWDDPEALPDDTKVLSLADREKRRMS